MGRNALIDIPAAPLSIDVLDPLNGLGVANFPKVSLCGRQISMSENDLAYDFQRFTCFRGIGGRMPSQVMWAQVNTDQSTRPFFRISRGGVLNGENPFLWLESLRLDVVPMSISYLLRDKYHL